jgi:hypothetical protein
VSQKLSITRAAGSQRTPSGSRAQRVDGDDDRDRPRPPGEHSTGGAARDDDGDQRQDHSAMTSGWERTTSPSAGGVSVPHASARVSARRASSGTVQKLVTSAATTSQRSA